MYVKWCQWKIFWKFISHKTDYPTCNYRSPVTLIMGRILWPGDRLWTALYMYGWQATVAPAATTSREEKCKFSCIFMFNSSSVYCHNLGDVMNLSLLFTTVVPTWQNTRMISGTSWYRNGVLVALREIHQIHHVTTGFPSGLLPLDWPTGFLAAFGILQILWIINSLPISPLEANKNRWIL